MTIELHQRWTWTFLLFIFFHKFTHANYSFYYSHTIDNSEFWNNLIWHTFSEDPHKKQMTTRRNVGESVSFQFHLLYYLTYTAISSVRISNPHLILFNFTSFLNASSRTTQQQHGWFDHKTVTYTSCRLCNFCFFLWIWLQYRSTDRLLLYIVLF